MDRLVSLLTKWKITKTEKISVLKILHRKTNTGKIPRNKKYISNIQPTMIKIRIQCIKTTRNNKSSSSEKKHHGNVLSRDEIIIS